MVMHHFVRQDTELDYGASPTSVTRHCTDIPCCLVLLVALAGFGYVANYGYRHGDPHRFLHLPNSQGQFCGRDAAVAERPVLYFCNSTGHLSPNNTVCVAECPNPPLVPTPQDCPMGPAADYHTRPVGKLLCVPSDHREALALSHVLKNPQVARLMEVMEVFRNWRPIAIVAGCAVLLGFLFCFFLETCAFCIFWGSLLFVVFCVLAVGAYLLYQTLQHDSFESANLPEITTGDAQKDLIAGAAACSVAFICLCIACCGAGVVNKALTSFKQAADCMTDVPSLLLQPFIDVILKIIAFMALAVGLWYLVSCASMSKTEDAYNEFELKYDKFEYVLIAYYIFMSYWILEVLDALSNFVISYAVQLWYHATRGGEDSNAPCFPTLQGLLAGITYHLGTFAFGSWIIACVRGLRDLMFVFTKQASDGGNAVLACCGCCCTCCLDLFNRFLKYMTKNAYMDTALNSNDFCKAAYHAVAVLITHAGEVATLNMATVIFQIAGVSGIAAGGAFIMHLLCEYWDELSNPESPNHVENRVTLYIVAAVVSAFVSLPFMVLLDQVSDTLLFCNAIERKRTPPPPPYTDDEYDRPTPTCCGCCYSSNPPPSNNGLERAALIDPRARR